MEEEKEMNGMEQLGGVGMKSRLCVRNPIPSGDARKYYYVSIIGTVILLTLCFYLAVVALALRTDECEQISNGAIFLLVLFCIASIVGLHLRSLMGYGISALSSLTVFLLLQFYKGTGVFIVSDLSDYGEVFRDAARSTDFWILIAKVVSIIHPFLIAVFILNAMRMKETPTEIKGMNLYIQRIKTWLEKDLRHPSGRRNLDYIFVVVSMILYMVFVAYDSSMGKYDNYSLGLFVVAIVLVFCKKSMAGAMVMTTSALIRCTLFQFRYGVIVPVVVAYLSFWVALLFLVFEVVRKRKRETRNKVGVKYEFPWVVLFWGGVAFFVVMFPVHEFLSVFSGSYMFYQKDNLPLYFFLPILMLLGFLSREWYGLVFGGGCCGWLYVSLTKATPLRNGALFYFDSETEHGAIGEHATSVLMKLTHVIAGSLLVFCALCLMVFLAYIFSFLRRRKNGNKEKTVD